MMCVETKCTKVYVDGVLISERCEDEVVGSECTTFCDEGRDGGGGDDGDDGGGGGGSSDNWSIDQTFGKLCDNINFKYSANSFTAEIQGLGGTYWNDMTNTPYDVELGVNCVDIPEYYIGTSYDAAVGFANIFNDARSQIEHELELGLLTPNIIAMRSRLITIITSELQLQYPGATFGSGECQGDVSLVDTYGSWPGGGGSNPGDLGQDIRSMSSNSSYTVTRSGGIAPSNSGTCP